MKRSRSRDQFQAKFLPIRTIACATELQKIPKFNLEHSLRTTTSAVWLKSARHSTAGKLTKGLFDLFRPRRSTLRLLILFMICLYAPALWAQKYYSAGVGIGTHHVYQGFASGSNCNGPYYIPPAPFEVQWGTLTRVQTLLLVERDNGEWISATATTTGNASLGWGNPGSVYVSSLSAGGVVTTTETGSFSVTLSDGGTESGTVTSIETLDLNNGKYAWHRTIDEAWSGSCPGQQHETQDRWAVLPITNGPYTPQWPSIGVVNPLATNNPPWVASGPVQATTVSSAPTATGLAADGVSAAVVVIESNSSAPVSLTLTAPSFSGTGSVGFLTAYDPNYASNPQSSGLTQLSSISPAVQVTNPDATCTCTFLALLWAPPNMPVSSADLSTGNFQSVTLNLSATQPPYAIPAQAGIVLQPSPLVLVHGVWSSASQAWPPFEMWLDTHYPHKLIFTADFGNYSSQSFKSPEVQNALDYGISNALGFASLNHVVAGKVDVFGHSMGGLVTRYFMLNGATGPFAQSTSSYSSGLSKHSVHRLVTVGSPHEGSALAASLVANQTNPPSSSTGVGTLINAFCSGCSLSKVLGILGQPLGTAVVALSPNSPDLQALTDTGDYQAIVGFAPMNSGTELLLDLLIGTYIPGQTDSSILGQPNDTIVGAASEIGTPTQTATINGVVHTAMFCTPLADIFDEHCSDFGETRSPNVWSQALYFLMGGSGQFAPASQSVTRPLSVSFSAGTKSNAQAPTSPLPIFDLSGYTQVDASNVAFSPASGAALTIGATTNITATPSTKTLLEVLLFQTVADPTDIPVFGSTLTPFSVAFTPTRLGNANFAAFAVFNDSTFAVVPLTYTLQPSGSALDLTLGAPVASLPVGLTTIVPAQAGFPNGAVDVTQSAVYVARSGRTNVFSVGLNGAITTTGIGVDWLDVGYGGQTASAQISVGNCTYALSPISQLVDQAGGTATIQVATQSGCAWSADTGGATWLTLTSGSGAGTGAITVTAASNSTTGTQTGLISVGNQTVVVAQPNTPCTYSVSPTLINAPASGASGTLTVTTSCPIVATSNADWVVPVNVNGSIDYSVATNPGVSQRSAILTIGTQAISVTQAGGTFPQVRLSLTSLTYAGQYQASTSPAQQITLTNSGSAALSISTVAISGTNASDFAQTNNCGASLAPSASCSLSVTFTSSTTGSQIASLVLTDNSNDSPQTVSLAGVGTSFALAAANSGSTTATVQAGQTAGYSLQLSPTSGFTGTVSLACTGAPSTTTCTVAPASISVTGNSASPFTVNVSTASRSGLVPNPFTTRRFFRGRSPWLLGVEIGILLCLIFLASLMPKNSRLRRARPLLMTPLLGLILLTGCGGGSSSSGGGQTGTQAGTYALVLAATPQQGGPSQKLNLTLTVQ
jgi:pimeloyl-ACP methyl ester carboxylesterase